MLYHVVAYITFILLIVLLILRRTLLRLIVRSLILIRRKRLWKLTAVRSLWLDLLIRVPYKSS